MSSTYQVFDQRSTDRLITGMRGCLTSSTSRHQRISYYSQGTEYGNCPSIVRSSPRVGRRISHIRRKSSGCSAKASSDDIFLEPSPRLVPGYRRQRLDRASLSWRGWSLVFDGLVIHVKESRRLGLVDLAVVLSLGSRHSNILRWGLVWTAN